MQVILLRDVPKVGKKFEVKNVPDGYVRNLLIPKGWVKEATPQAIKELEQLKAQERDEESLHDSLLNKNFDELKEIILTIHGKINEEGHLFASIHKEDILTRLKDQYHIVLTKESLLLDKPIKGAGIHEIPVSIKDRMTNLKVVVEGE